MTKEQILREALALEPHERDELAEALWQSIGPTDFTPEQLAEIRRRIEAVDGGREKSLAGEQVMEELHRRYPDVPPATN